MNPINLVSLYFLLFLTLCTSKTVYWVNNGAKQDGDGSESSPFLLVSKAIEKVRTMYDIRLDNDFEIVLESAGLPYEGWDLLFEESTHLFLAISSRGPKNKDFLEETCSDYPILSLKGQDQFKFANLNSLAFRNVSFIFDNIVPEIWIQNLETFNITNSCFKMGGSPEYSYLRKSESFVNAIEVKSINVKSLWVERQWSEYSLIQVDNHKNENSKVRFEDIVVYSQEKTHDDSAAAIFDFENLMPFQHSFLAERISIGFSNSSHSDSFHLKNVFSLLNFNEVSFNGIQIASSNKGIFGNLFQLKNLNTLSLTEINLNIMEKNIEPSDLFLLKNINQIDIKKVSITNSRLENTTVFRYSYITYTQQDEIISDLTIDDLHVSESLFQKSSILSTSLVSPSVNGQLSLSNIEFENVNSTGSNFIQFYVERSLNPLANKEIDARNISLRNCSFISSKVLTTQFHNDVTLKNISGIDGDYWSKNFECSLFEIRALRKLEIADVSFMRNDLFGYYVFSIYPSYKFGLFHNGTFTDTTFNNSGVVTSNDLYEDETTDLASILEFQGVTFDQIQVRNQGSKAVLDFDGFGFFVTNCHFKSININSGAFILFKEVDETKVVLTLDDLEKILNQTTNGSSRLARIRDYNSEAQVVYKEQSNGVLQQNRFENNTIWNVTIVKSENILLGMAPYAYSRNFILVVHPEKNGPTSFFLKNNSIREVTTRNNFVVVILCGYVKFSDNDFSVVNGSGDILDVQAFMSKQILSIERNTVDRLVGPQFTKLASKDMKLITFADNIINNSIFGWYGLEFVVQRTLHSLEFHGNSFSNISFDTAKDERLIDVFAQQGKLNFSNNSIHDAKLPYKDLENAIHHSSISLVVKEGEILLESFHFDFEDEDSQIKYIIIEAPQLLLKDSSISVGGVVTGKKLLSVYSDDIFIQNVAFSSTAPTIENITVLHVDCLHSGQHPIQLIFDQNTFSFNPNSSNQLITFGKYIQRNANLDLTFTGNNFNEITEMHFKDVKFSKFMIHDSSLQSTKAGKPQDWLTFTNCSGNVSIQNILFTAHDNVGINFISIRSSPQISLSTSQLKVGAQSDDQRIAKLNSLQIIDTDSGNIRIDGFYLANSSLLSPKPMFLVASPQYAVNMVLNNLQISNLSHHFDVQRPLVEVPGLNEISYGLVDIQNRNQMNLTITDSLFENIIIHNQGGILRIVSDGKLDVKIVNTSLNKNSLSLGTVLSVFSLDRNSQKSYSQKVSIKDSKIVGNKAINSGGVISLQNTELNFENSTYSNNSVDLGPSILLDKVKGFQTLLDSSSLRREEIGLSPYSFIFKYRRYLGYQQVKIEYLELVDGVGVSIYDVTSYELNFVEIQILDESGRPFDVPLGSSLKIITTDDSITSSCNRSLCSTNNISTIIGGYAGDTETLKFKYQASYFEISTTIIVQFRDCVTGEVRNTINQKKGCKPCPTGEYSFDPNSTSCMPCPAGVKCTGRDSFELELGYWRNSTISDIVIPCDKIKLGNVSRCSGGYNSTCKAGFTGPMCHQCDFKNEYVRAGSDTDFSCGKCPQSNWRLYLSGFLFFMAFLGIEIYLISSAIKTGRYYYEAALNGQADDYQAVGPFLGLITTYFQIVTIICSFDVKLFTYFFRFVSIVGEPQVNIFFSVDCLLLRWNVNPEDLLRIRIILLLLSPVLKYLAVIIYCVIKGLNRTRKMILGATGLTLFLLEQPQVITVLIGYLTCRKLDPYDATTFVKGNEYFQCDTAEYNTFKYWVVYPAALFFCLFPLVLLWILYRKKKQEKLDDEWVRVTLGLLYNGLDKKSYFWGIVNDYAKIGLIVITKIYIINNPELLAPLLIAWLYLYRLYLAYQKPYLSHQLYQAENYAVNSYLVTIFCAYFMIGNEEKYYLIAFYLLLVVLANAYAVGYVMFVVFIISKKMAKDEYVKIKKSKFWQLIARLFFFRKRKRKEEERPKFNSKGIISSMFDEEPGNGSDYRKMDDSQVEESEEEAKSNSRAASTNDKANSGIYTL